MSPQTVIFYCLAVIIILSAVIATFARNIVNAAYGLFFTLLALGGVYVLLRADFLAVTQIVIYVGGILVLLLFGILLTNRRLEDLIISGQRSSLLGVVMGCVIFAVLLAIIFYARWPQSENAQLEGTTAPLGYLLLQNFLLPFEFSSITLLAALLGASYLVRPSERD
ncbi:MAG: NADH-quinone oxidoreductase subunit J [bacterium]|nr:NADH-quinone oxidoreductase subunit J [Candidatus Sumerlaeota bacterium]